MKGTIVSFILLFILILSSGAKRVQGQDMDANNEIRTPRPKPQPRINGPLVYGCRPGNPFLYRIPCQGERPVHFSAKGLPQGLKLDASTGIISGITPKKGEYQIVIQGILFQISTSLI